MGEVISIPRDSIVVVIGVPGSPQVIVNRRGSSAASNFRCRRLGGLVAESTTTASAEIGMEMPISCSVLAQASWHSLFVVVFVEEVGCESVLDGSFPVSVA